MTMSIYMIAGDRSSNRGMFQKEWGEEFCDQDVVHYRRTSVANDGEISVGYAKEV